MLRMVKWPPVRIQHEMAALLFLNKVAMLPDVEFLYETISHHLRFPNGKEVLKTDYNTRANNFLNDVLSDDWVPFLGMNNDDRKFMGKRVKNVFPLCSMEWFNKLPNFIKYRIGTKSFETAIYGWFHTQCWCRYAKDCSRCKQRKQNVNFEYNDIKQIYEELAAEEDTTLDEWTIGAEEDLNTFEWNMTMENDVGETFEQDLTL